MHAPFSEGFSGGEALDAAARGPPSSQEVDVRRTALRATETVALVALVAAAWTAGAESAKRPVTAPGSEPPPPPPKVEVATPSKDASAPAAEAGKQVEKVVAPEAKPVEQPAAPAAFKDEVTPTTPPTVQRAVDPNPRELRYSKENGGFLFAMVVRPGKPKPHTPTEIVFQIDELLPIPDPALGDRRPVEKAELVARVTGPDGTRTFELHPMTDKGEYGFHFTPTVPGLYSVACQRVAGRPPLAADFALGVGVETPTPSDDGAAGKGNRRRGLLGGGNRRAAAAGPDDSTAAGVMAELGDEWLALRRTAGTPEAAAPMGKVLDHARKLAGKVPAGFPEGRSAFDQLAAKFVADLEAMQGRVADPAATAELDRMQGATCLRCHAQFRFGVAESVDRWPDFTKRSTPLAKPAAGKDSSRKLPVALPGKE
jgi:hypothetical protein